MSTTFYFFLIGVLISDSKSKLLRRIRKNIRFDESPIESKSVFERDVKANGAEDYLALAEEISGTKRPDQWPYIPLNAWLQEHPADEGVKTQLAELTKAATTNH